MLHCSNHFESFKAIVEFKVIRKIHIILDLPTYSKVVICYFGQFYVDFSIVCHEMVCLCIDF